MFALVKDRLKIPTDVPYLLFIMVFINIFFFSMQQTMVYSFLPKWIKSFGVDEVDVGAYAGIIASAIYVGTCISSLLWGYISDTLSRKAGILLSGIGCLIGTLAFGFSMNVTWATLSRGVQGLASGQIIVFKAFMGEVCDQDTLAYGLAVMMSSWAVGNVIGPSIGGWTAFPAEIYPSVFSKDGVFGRFSAFLPNIIIAAGLGVGVLFTLLFFPKQERNEDESRILLSNTEKKCGYSSMEGKHPTDKRNSKSSSERNLTQRIKSLSLVRVLSNKGCMICSVLYILTAIADIGMEEIFPVFASTPTAYKGLGFTPAEVGTVLMITFIACVVFQLTLLPKLNNYIGAKRFLILSNFILVFVTPFLPMITAIQNSTLKWFSLIVILFVNRSCAFAEVLAINVLINNSVEPELLGSANGVTYMAANIGRLIGPLLCGGVYSWSLRNIKGIDGNENALGFPFNQFLTFLVLSGLSVLVAVISAMLDDGLDRRKGTSEKSSESS